MISYGRQDINEDDIDAVVKVLQSDFLTQGSAVPSFETAVASHVGAQFAVAVNSATSALHIAALALGLQKGDVLWTSPVTFVASANCALYCGAQVDFVDIDPDTFNMCPKALEAKLVAAEKHGNLPKIIVPVHMAGQSPDMVQIAALAKRYDIKIIEDASHAIGARYKECLVGAGRYSDITIFSFHPVKIITTGEGGMALTNNPELYHKLTVLRNHGITRDHEHMTKAPHGAWYYEQIALGLNYRMTDIQAALGISQMTRLAQFVETRTTLSSYYDTLLQDLPVMTPQQEAGAKSAHHLYIIRLNDELVERHCEIFDKLRAQDIGVNLHYIPVHLQPYYQALGFSYGDFPLAEDYYKRAITLPLHPQLQKSDIEQVVAALHIAIHG